ncbi:MAG: M16 family metallopeptidase [Flavobacteriales bacterium]
MKYILPFLVIVFLSACVAKKFDVQNPIRVEEGERDPLKYRVFNPKVVDGDPLKVKEYTLKNGLKVFLTVNKENPRIQTQVCVRAGGKNDPSNATGLAHYLEHLLFKGTSKLGTIDYTKEKIELDKIKQLYEQYRLTSDEFERDSIYNRIDSISAIASKYACLSELDQAHSIIGATGTNAYTSNDNTAYITNIPSNQLENWLKIESERYREPVIRLFHTELEAVYEEKNISQDNHWRQQYYLLLSELFKKHNYGLQTTIGTIEHLKNPSIIEIEKFFKHYYVPNNMAIILSGDFNPDSAIFKIDTYFGGFEPSPVNEYIFEAEEPLASPIERTIQAPDASSVLMAYRLPKSGEREVYLATMVDMILNNSKAGLMDLNINQKQKAVGVYSGITINTDYSYHILGGSPTKGQTLKELRNLILEQLEIVKKGDFPDWLMPAIINDFKLSELKGLKSNRNRVAAINEVFVHGLEWEDKVNEIEVLSAISKQEVIDFVNGPVYQNNYVLVYKEKTDDKLERQKVPKPEITPLDIPKTNQSEFLKEFISNNNPKPIEPSFIDFKKEIDITSIKKDVKLHYCKNENDELFSLKFIYPIGSYHNPKLSLAVQQAKLLGTSAYSSAELSQEMYKIGMSYSISVGQKETSINLSGLTSQLEKSFQLLNHIIFNIKASQEVTDGLIQKTLQLRENAVNNPKSILWNGLQNYAVYGEESPLSDQLSNKKLEGLISGELLYDFKHIFTFKPQVLFYGESNVGQVNSVISNSLLLEGEILEPSKMDYERKAMNQTEIYVLDYDLKKSEILFLSKGTPFNNKELATNSVFNEYYGGGMSSVVFQEIREKKALAYQAFAVHTTAKDTTKPQYTYAYLGCQTDKTVEAIESMLEVLKNMPKDTVKFSQSISAIKQQLASSRTTRASKLSSFWANQKLGFIESKNEQIYTDLEDLTLDDIVRFHIENIANNQYSIVIVADLSEPSLLSDLERFGKVKVVTVEDLYPY